MGVAGDLRLNPPPWEIAFSRVFDSSYAPTLTEIMVDPKTTPRAQQLKLLPTPM